MIFTNSRSINLLSSKYIIRSIAALNQPLSQQAPQRTSLHPPTSRKTQSKSPGPESSMYIQPIVTVVLAVSTGLSFALPIHISKRECVKTSTSGSNTQTNRADNCENVSQYNSLERQPGTVTYDSSAGSPGQTIPQLPACPGADEACNDARNRAFNQQSTGTWDMGAQTDVVSGWINKGWNPIPNCLFPSFKF